MTAYQEAEVQPGSVIHLDPGEIIRQGDVSVKTRLGTEVQGAHYFLILNVSEGMVVATPLFSRQGAQHIELTENKKLGRARHWLGISTYMYRWQHWRFPVSSISSASANDDSSQADRRSYSSHQLAALFIDQNTENWREL